MARRRRSSRNAVRRAVLVVGVVVLVAGGAATLFAGSPSRLPPGTTVGGLDVGGLGRDAATAALERRSDALEHEPVEFVAAGRTFSLRASQLGVRPAWAAAVREAAASTDGFAPVRGLKRVRARIFGEDVEPRVDVFPSVLRYTVGRIAAAVDRPAVDASVARHGLSFVTTPPRPGARLDKARAAATIVTALASLERDGPVRLPIARAEPHVLEDDLATALTTAQTAVSGPVTLTVGPTRFRLPRWKIAQLLDLPDGGATRVSLAGPSTARWLASLARSVDRTPRDATFRVVSGGIELVPSHAGRRLDLAAARTALENAVFSTTGRAATVATSTTPAARTTEDARAMGIDEVVGSYTTTYGGTPGRLHNVQLVAELIDGALVAPGARFSFNETTGERNAAKGFEEAPVIINGELESGIGGGVCQVSTTVFNAAFEAGLSIEKRTNHALYISHYPLGRDATVNYPDLDLVFRNDTEHWLLLRTFVSPGSLTVNLYGTSPGRRVETETAPLEVEGKVPWKRIDDDTMFKGQKLVEQWGSPPRSTSVTRRVYKPDGTLLYDTTWRSYYVGEPTVVRLGTKPRPKPEPAKPDAKTSTTRTMKEPPSPPQATTTTSRP
ncbi:MAG TPA: VanW family protein [Gaiella sp.]|nr:VanW family protein [Gaiella sp.]